MLLDDLVKAISGLRTRIEDHRSVLEENETRTRMALIDPLLQTLGWDTSDPNQLVPEYQIDKRWVDYALLDTSGKPVAVIEAKRLNESLEKHRTQMITYANMVGIPFAGLTNGNKWELYTVFHQAPIKERQILSVSISKNPPHECALKLLMLWRANLESKHPIEANLPIISIDKSQEQSSEHSSDPGKQNNWISITDCGKPTGRPHPLAIQFEDGPKHEIRSWRGLLQETAVWLSSKNLLNNTNVPVRSTDASYIVALDGTHPTGTKFRSPIQVNGTSLIVEGNLRAKEVITRIMKLLKHCEKDPSKIRIQMHNS